MALPTDIDTVYVDRSPGDKLHQQHHDIVHALLNVLTETGTLGQFIKKQAGGSYAWENAIVNTDGNPGQTIYIGATDPNGTYTLEVGDVWIEMP